MNARLVRLRRLYPVDPVKRLHTGLDLGCLGRLVAEALDELFSLGNRLLLVLECGLLQQSPLLSLFQIRGVVAGVGAEAAKR